MDPQRVIDWVEHHVEDRAEAVFLAGNGFRAAGAIDELELRTGRLVIEANQALLWGILAATRHRLGHHRPRKAASHWLIQRFRACQALVAVILCPWRDCKS